jgi:MFS family permease
VATLAPNDILITLRIFYASLSHIFYISPYTINIVGSLQRLGLDALSVLNAGSVIGRIIPGILADKIGRYNTFIPAGFAAGFWCLVLWLPTKSAIATFFFAALYGFFSGAFVSLAPAALAQISKMEKLGTRIGLYYGILPFA